MIGIASIMQLLLDYTVYAAVAVIVVVPHIVVCRAVKRVSLRAVTIMLAFV